VANRVAVDLEVVLEVVAEAVVKVAVVKVAVVKVAGSADLLAAVMPEASRVVDLVASIAVVTRVGDNRVEAGETVR
jgi:hypothetical protein